jgi:hypothetical protein
MSVLHAVDTAPLPPAAVKALARLEAKLRIIRAVTEYETAAVHAAQLGDLAEYGRMTDLDADSLDLARDLMADAHATLAEAGMLHLLNEATAEHETAVAA